MALDSFCQFASCVSVDDMVRGRVRSYGYASPWMVDIIEQPFLRGTEAATAASEGKLLIDPIGHRRVICQY